MRITRLATAGAAAGLLVLGAAAPAFATPHPPIKHPPIKHFPCKPPKPEQPKPGEGKPEVVKPEVAQQDAAEGADRWKHWKHCKPTPRPTPPKPTPTVTVTATKTPIPIPSGPIDTGDGSSLQTSSSLPLIFGGSAVLLLGTGMGVVALRRRTRGESA